MLSRDEIQTFLPHRPPMLLVDGLLVDAQGDARGKYTVRGDEYFLQGHFPDFPVVPGVIICEMIAQTAGVLVREALAEGKMPLFAGMEGVRFRRMVRPGDQVDCLCKLVRISGQLIKVEGEARVNDQLCVQGVFLLMLSGKAG